MVRKISWLDKGTKRKVSPFKVKRIKIAFLSRGVKPRITPYETEGDGHWSDCAVHNEPAYPKGECDCGGTAVTS